ncbi:RagB/SusD family nutrient uptake outer membrane protein [Dyadobacter luteus]|jgi:tetratricopeptide (TPR) repeat protein|uniref:RagB/SusD family nutrient uptake outer membrane protein n=1 Tax=Dyadobacter luteus TaxID=2259619 RepID=A0A3D8YG40_9BACT|nr:RagB/SusD family nutrient uptake outer membrane protein [Dyadobacter luteus]REA63645.1 RagB/SusD family nutrient uptake outer membrane protein [Dyadobacter luteus]
MKRILDLNTIKRFKPAAKKVAVMTTLGLGLVLLASCGEFLEIAPKETISEELAIVDKTSLNTAVRGAYRRLGNAGYYGEGYVNLGFIPSGDVIYNVFNNVSDLNFRADDGAFAGSWAAIYATINLVNHIIEKAPQITDVNLTDAQRNAALGEAHFLRGLAYFDLARGWGGVPLKLKPTSDLSQDTGIPRATLEQTYKQVLEDLDLAEQLLPEQLNRVRATRYTVWALKARFYLYNKNWTQAVNYADKVIALNNHFRLVAPFNSWFSAGVVQTQESILEIAFSAQNPSALRTRMSLLSRGGEYRYRPSDNLVATLRNPGTGGHRRALLDSATQAGTTQYAGALYYRSPATDPSYVIRIAELYLIRSEALAQLGNLPKALLDLNLIRNRAGLGNLSLNNDTEVLAAVLEERRLEFLWEAHRYFDLSRTGKLKEKIEQLKPNLKIQPHLNLFPIPIDEVILDKLQQNPGY